MDLATLGFIVGIASLFVAAVTFVPSWISARPARIQTGTARFRSDYARLRQNQNLLVRQELDRSPSKWRNYPLPLLTETNWIFDEPKPLTAIELQWSNELTRPQNASTKLSRIRGVSLAGPIPYSQALVEVLNLNFQNGSVYRPLLVEVRGKNSLRISFSEAQYFDYLDTSEYLAYERSNGNSTYRSKLRDPFDFTNRFTSLGILTLTIRREHESCYFVMHRRTDLE